MTDHVLLIGLQQHRKDALEFLYSKHFPSIAAYIRANSGSNSDAEDIFQETLIAVLKNIQHSDFKLEASLKTYIYSIAKNLWLKKLRDSKMVFIPELPINLTEEACGHDREEQEEKLTTWLGSITIHCQNVLRAIYFLKASTETLMQQMGWKNRHTANNQKYKCLQQIIKAKDEDELGH